MQQDSKCNMIITLYNFNEINEKKKYNYIMQALNWYQLSQFIFSEFEANLSITES